jgi:Arc/MetJ-type ribon-helix-helix transcriptional regulator
MNIILTPEQEQIVKEELTSGQFHTPEEVISHALRALQGKTNILSKAEKDERYRHAVAEMLDFVEKNRTFLQDVSVKQLIHEGHRL